MKELTLLRLIKKHRIYRTTQYTTHRQRNYHRIGRKNIITWYLSEIENVLKEKKASLAVKIPFCL